jgi:hypothetical protein
MNPVKLSAVAGPYENGDINNGGLYNTGGSSASQGMDHQGPDKPVTPAPADQSYLNMQNNLKSL